MAFRNEYVPPLEQETSEFLRKVRTILCIGNTRYDRWTVDRDHGMVLIRSGGGHEADSADLDIWDFIDHERHYSFTTECLKKQNRSKEDIAITYELGAFIQGEGYAMPDPETIVRIKDALQEYGRRYLFNLEHYKRCYVTLINRDTGKEI